MPSWDTVDDSQIAHYFTAVHGLDTESLCGEATCKPDKYGQGKGFGKEAFQQGNPGIPLCEKCLELFPLWVEYKKLDRLAFRSAHESGRLSMLPPGRRESIEGKRESRRMELMKLFRGHDPQNG